MVLSISDDGPGILPQNLTRVFEPFFTTKPGGEGTGLGLAISFEIVNELGGSMSASNNPDRGACFRHRTAAARGRLSVAPVLQEKPARRERILIIDDDPGLAESS